MEKICKICESEFITDNYSRIYCYTCSGDSTRRDNETRKHQKTVLRRSMKLQAIKILGNKCCKCGYDRCVDALEFHHKNPEEKDFKIGSGNTLSWDEYKKEALKCILVCSNCHTERVFVVVISLCPPISTPCRTAKAANAIVVLIAEMK